MLLGDDGATTAAATALRVLAAEHRSASSVAESSRTVSDDELVARYPVLLSLVPPSIGAEIKLPPPPASPPPAPPVGGEASVRESLRLRIRWVHEVTARAAMALGQHLVDRGAFASASHISSLRLDEVATLIESEVSLTLELRVASQEVAPAPPLPAAFRLDRRPPRRPDRRR